MMEGGSLFSLKGKTVVVTGASGALGGHFTRVLARNGAKVTATGRQTDRLDALVGELLDAGYAAKSALLDVTDVTAVEAGFDAAEQAFGPVDILVNNSGIAATTPVEDIEAVEWNQVIGTNLTGAFLCAREFARRRIAGKQAGVIVNVASILGLRVAGHVAAYAASKAALLQLTRSLALELARHSIRVNALAPGYVRTALNRDFFETPAGAAIIRRIPQRRLGELDDLDGPLLLLASNASRFMTGSVVAIDGGHLVSGL